MGFARVLTNNAVYRVCNLLVLFLITILLSRAMGAEGYGILSLLIANASLFNLATSFGSDAAITYNVASGFIRKNDFVSIVFAILLLQIVLLGLTEAISFSVNGHFWLLKTDNQRLWWAGVCFLLGISVQEKIVAALNGKQLYTISNRIILASNLVTLTVFALFFIVSPIHNSTQFLVLYVLLSLFQAIAITVLALSFSSLSFTMTRLDKKQIVLFFSYSLLVFLINSIQFLAYRIDFWLLDFYKDERQVGIYSLAVRLAQLYWILPLLFASIIFPVVVAAKAGYQKWELMALLRISNWINSISGVILLFTIKPIIRILFGDEYQLSAIAFSILLPGVIFFGNCTILAAYFAGMNKLRVNFFGSLICLVIIFSLDVILIPIKGFIGAAVASSIGYFVTGIYFITVYCRGTNTPFVTLLLPQKTDWRYLQSFIKNMLITKR